MRFTLKGHHVEVAWTRGSNPGGPTLAHKDDSPLAASRKTRSPRIQQRWARLLNRYQLSEEK